MHARWTTIKSHLRKNFKKYLLLAFALVILARLLPPLTLAENKPLESIEEISSDGGDGGESGTGGGGEGGTGDGEAGMAEPGGPGSEGGEGGSVGDGETDAGDGESSETDAAAPDDDSGDGGKSDVYAGGEPGDTEPGGGEDESGGGGQKAGLKNAAPPGGEDGGELEDEIDSEKEGEGDAVYEDVFTLSFYIGDMPYAQQFLAEGGAAHDPGEPPVTAFPDGYVSFVGWFEDGAPDDEPYDFNIAVTGDLSLYARFSDKYLVRFTDGFGDVYITERVEPDSFISEPAQAQLDAMPMPPDRIFEYWTPENDGTDVPYDSGTPKEKYIFGAVPVTGDITLYPALANKVYVFFISYGTEVPPAALKAGQTAPKPAEDPTRKNYTFNYWTAAPDGSGAEYDWGEPVDSNLMLYASWTGVPDSVDYKIVYWLEAPDFDGVPTPGSMGDYVFTGEIIKKGTPGEKINITAGDCIIPGNPSKGVNDPLRYSMRATDDPLRYADFQYSPETVITGHGNAIVNVYMTRKVYTLTFVLPVIFGKPAWMKFKDGETLYTYDSYKINVKYECNITDIWPSTAIVEFSPPKTVGNAFISWLTVDVTEGVPPNTYTHGAANSYAPNWTTRRHVFNSEMMPLNPEGDGYSLKIQDSMENNLNIRYWFDEYCSEQTGTERYFTDNTAVTKRYILDEKYNHDKLGNVVPKQIPGTKYIGADYSDSESEPGCPHNSYYYVDPSPTQITHNTEHTETHVNKNMYYERLKYTLSYDTGKSGIAIPPASGIVYGRYLGAYKPADPVWPGNKFIGWYKDTYGAIEFNFDETQMPSSNLTIFAKWESQDNIVTFWDGNEKLGEQGVADDETVNFNSLVFNGVRYQAGLFVPGKGVMLGWQYDPLGIGYLMPYPADLNVRREYDLHVRWRASGFKVIYHQGDAAPESAPPADGAAYVVGSYARVLSGAMVPPESGKTFIGWRAEGSGATYYPGSFIRIAGDMNMYPYFIDDADLSYIEFNKNFAAVPETITVPVEAYAETILTDGSIFTSIPPDSLFINWRTLPAGGTPYNKNERVRAGAPGSTAIFYAAWASTRATITFNGNGDKNATLINITLNKNTIVNINKYAPADLEKEGYIFGGWARTKGSAAAPVAPNITLTADLILYALWIADKKEPEPEPEPEPELVPAATPTPSPKPTTSPSPSPTPTAAPTPSSNPIAIPTLSPTPTITPTPSPKPTTTPTPSPKPIAIPTLSPIPTTTPTPSPLPSPTLKPTPSTTPQRTSSPSPLSSPPPKPTLTPAASPEVTPAPSAAPEPTLTPTPSPSPKPSPLSTPRPSPSPTSKPTPKSSPTPSPLPSPAPTPTLSPTSSPALSPTPKPAPSTEPDPTPAPTLKPPEIPDISIPRSKIPSWFTMDHIQYINGYPGGTVMPDANITRAETAAFIYRLMLSGFANNKFENIFPDVDRNAWYAEAVNYLASIDIVLGFPDGSFKPDNPITRAEYATMISKFDNLESGAGVAYGDTAGHWAAGYIGSASAKGWISGYSDGSYQPENNITRAEVVSSVNRMLHRMIMADDVPGWAPSYTDLPLDHWAYAAIIEASIDHDFELKYPETDSFLEKWIRPHY